MGTSIFPTVAGHRRTLCICGARERRGKRKARDSAREKRASPKETLRPKIMDAFGISVTPMFLKLNGNKLLSLC